MTTKQRLEGMAGVRWHRALPGLLTLGCLCALLALPAWAAGPRTRLPTAQKSFVDQLDAYDTRRWTKADGWVNGSPFANAWRADHVTFQAGSMHLVLSSQAYLGMAYSSGELRTKGFYGYGCYEARFKPVKRAGVVTSFFTFAGPFDNGGNGRHNEIDIEFVGDDTEAVQLNFWANDDRYISRNENSCNWVSMRRRKPTRTASDGPQHASSGFSMASRSMPWTIRPTTPYRRRRNRCRRS
jgi:hypothetical protein